MIELLIVVAIILIIAALAIPSLLRSKIAANEASAASSLKQIGTANVLYLQLYNQGYAGTLAQLGPPGSSCPAVSSDCADLIDGLLSGVAPPTPSPVKSGYTFSYYSPNASPTTSAPNITYAAVAAPLSPATGVSSFCADGGNVYVIWRDTAGGTTTATGGGCAPTWVPGGSTGTL